LLRLNLIGEILFAVARGVQSNYPELANSIAKERIEQALQTKAEFLVTICPLCYYHLGRNSKEIHVFEISQLLVKCI
jgi:Fe-S oxidoreductase